jgi:hypothetical protein
VKKMAKSLNSKNEIQPTYWWKHWDATELKLIEESNSSNMPVPSTISVKLTGDGTQIARGLNVVNPLRYVLESRKACSSSGNYPLGRCPKVN